ncbi:MAG TPA: helix-turn-helix domain-containing protein [Acidimicrobiales bacterium]|nr:helix-turn-helix domain-containing protein [Acidimicrobiales bacterium]
MTDDVRTPTGVGPRAARLSANERREHFLDVTAELVISRGVESVTMEAVAAAAGVSKGLGYAYFSNRNELLLSLLNRELGELQRRSTEEIRAASDFEGRIRAGVHAWFDVMAEKGALIGTLLQTQAIAGPLAERRKSYNQELQDFYGRLAEKEFGIPRRKSVATAAILLAGMSGIIERWRNGDSRRLLEETYVDVVLGSLRSMASPDRDVASA